MQRFVFSLENVLRHREQREQEAATKQAAALDQLNLLRDALTRTTATLEETFNLVSPRSLDTQNSLNIMLYRESLKNLQAKQSLEVDGAAVRFESCRQKTIEARKDKLLMEKLKDSKQVEYRREVALEEQKTSDEQGLQIYMRKNVI